MVADIPDLRKAFSEIEIDQTAHKPKASSVCVCSPVLGRDVDGTFKEEDDSVYLYSRVEGEISVQALLEKIAGDLDRVGHVGVERHSPNRIQIASKILGLSVLSATDSNETLDIVNGVVASLSPANVAQWAVLPGILNSTSIFHFGDFSYGQVDLEKLSSRCRRAGSDYFNRYGHQLRRHGSIFREQIGNLLDPLEFKNLIKTHSRLAYRIIDDYFLVCSESFKQQFILDIDPTQVVYQAGGVGVISSNDIRRLDSFTNWITVFTRAEKGHGWVVPTHDMPTLSFPLPEYLEESCRALKVSLKIEQWEERGFDPIIKTYCEYLVTANAAKAKDDLAGAILHLVFALDLLLGGGAEQALTTVLSERVSLLCHCAMGEEFEQLKKFVRDCYNKRSGYAHRGEKGNLHSSSKPLAEIECKLMRLCRIVLAATFSVRREPWCVEKSRDRWLARIDSLLGKQRGGEEWTAEELAELGITKIQIDKGGMVGFVEL